jgi:Ni/Fe-hydrogenase subunit HybB-like protein
MTALATMGWWHIPLFYASPFKGYVYPNETVIPWSGLIVVYPYITGLVAGAFIVSSFYHVFGMSQFRPVARLALLTALAFMICVPTPLALHLGHPERALEAMVTPHWSSAFVAFSYAASFYLSVLLLETWFAFRTDIVAMAAHGRGLRRFFYRVLTLGSDDVSEHALAYDHRWAYALAVIGIPSAVLLHGYVGFVFGSLKSRQWWSSDLMPVVFLLSAVVSGIALLIVLYITICRIRRIEADRRCLSGLTAALWSFLIPVLVVEALEYLTMFYRAEEGIGMIKALMLGPLYGWLLIQWGGSIIAFFLLTWLLAFRHAEKPRVLPLVVAAVLVLVEVFCMRWNVVIGGQELSKTMRGLLYYSPPILGRDGVVALAMVLILPLLILSMFVRLFPPWNDMTAKHDLDVDDMRRVPCSPAEPLP